jgi:hypothetical protein
MREINTATTAGANHSNNNSAYHGGTPLSQRPLRDQWDDSPMTAGSEQPFPRYFSPYSSQFNSPVSATDHLQQQQQWPVLGGAEKHATPHEVERSIGLAFGGVDANSSVDVKGHSDGKRPEEYEMHRVESTYTSPVDNTTAQQRDESYFTHGHERSYSGTYRNFAGSRASHQGYN